jgi:oligopeptide transport system substrate-binding protein
VGKTRILLLALGFTLVVSACTRRHSGNPNILQLATVAQIKGMDPALAEDTYSNAEVVRVYETLLQYHPYKRPYELEPLLAAEMPSVSKDGLTYTFKLKKGVLFQDDAAFPNGQGREVKAKDFVYSLMRLADPKVQSTGFWILEGRVKGLDEWHEKLAKDPSQKANYDEEIPGLKAIDDYTVQIQLKQPYPQLLNALAMPYTSVVAREAVEKYGLEFLNHAVGTGPFVLEKFAPNDQITYKRNPKFREELFPSEGSPGDKEAGLLADAGKKIPFVDGIQVHVVKEDQPRWLLFMKGDIDAIAPPKDNFDTAVKVIDPKKPLTDPGNLEVNPELKAKGVELTASVALDITFDLFNLESTEVPQFKDKRVRQAISLALDDTDAIRLFYNYRALPAQGPIPPGLNGYDPNLKNPYRTGNLEKAKQLLKDAGYPDGKGFPEIPFDTLADSTARQMAEYDQKQLDKIGLKLKVISNTWPAMLKRIQNHQTQLWGYAWGADYPDAENFLQLFYGPNARPGGMNSCYYKNKDYDKLLEKARVLPDSPARTEMYKKLAGMLVEDTPVIWGVHRIAVGLRHPWIKNSKFDEFPFNRAKYLRIDLEAKQKFGN